ncbi:1-deoxy-D-xylulose-5-phosphate synthase [Amphibacillus marinus]|uniref:1-deoxy-D-xylulose-5-phosphate synthase n=1 Tax=Amphibacillus marinus TaxID=872970 RepID=A0A1H8NKR6_9BACI|nr:1-deoxy-D-xylulose-5-phosphate synthase [Amphibacillus marinus]SEO30167.1 1-deoxy-D-xylulose-5-phosphate synthase [Amphibacillus marinus]
MDLTKIKNPKFLKKLTDDEMEVLAQELRYFLIEQLAVTGGHLGSNLGVVELTLALHREFNSPKDKLLFDVGHQSYVHKILTGRAIQFQTLRQYQGLSGFPKHNESEHDVWETGHSSTSLSGAMGMAIARDIKEDNNFIVPIIGDGALTGGMAFEALNHIGHEKTDMIVILNDNEMSIANNVGALHQALGRMRSAAKYNKAKDDFEWLLKRIPAVGNILVNATGRLKDSMKYFMVPGMLFEEFGFTYFGPVDGHDIQALRKHIGFAKKTSGPVIIHVITKKGKGYLPAETDPKDRWHGVGPYKIESGEKITSASKGTAWSKVVSDALVTEAEVNEKLVVITPAMILGSKLERFAKRFPDRLFDVGIAEQHATTMAAGLATQGMKPFLAIYSTFLQRAYDQMLHDICRVNLNVIIGIDRAGLVGADGETHHGIYDIAYLRSMPNLVIMMPVDEHECRQMIATAMAYNDGPVAIRYPRGNSDAVTKPVSVMPLPIGKWEVVNKGEDLVILAFGPMLALAQEVVKQLTDYGLTIEVVNARFIKPLDHVYLSEVAKRNIPLLTIEEAVLAGGFGSAILEWAELNDCAHIKIKRMGIPDRFIEHGDVNLLLQEVGLTTNKIVEKIKQWLPIHMKRVR